MDFLDRLLEKAPFMPHGHCYLWSSDILWLHVMSDALIGLAYYSIPILLWTLVRRRRDLAFGWMFVMFGVFILGCGTTHFMDILTTWHPLYRLEGLVKGLTALASVATAILLVPLVPKVLALPSPALLAAKNAELQAEIEERRRVAEQLRQAQLIIHTSEDAIFTWTVHGAVTTWNPGAERMLGYSADEIVGRDVSLLVPADRPTEIADLAARLAGGERISHFVTRRVRKDGAAIDVSVTLSPMRGPGEKVTGIAASWRDITLQTRTEEALRHSQKLESLGLLAGGVAHDFNNLLGVMLGQASLALKKLPPQSPVRSHIEETVAAVNRAADVARQMLAYSGRGRFRVEPVDVNNFVQHNVQLLAEAAVGKNVVLRSEIQEPLPKVDADLGQLQQVVMNLVLNAAEAIGDRSGTVTVATGTEEIARDDQRYSQHTGKALGPGTYVRVAVRDTGSGMDAHTVSRMFEPFFTTKFTGRGLGLAAVFGIVRGHRGGLRVESVLNQGTCITVLLPASVARETQSAIGVTAVARGQGTILIVDDEPALREMLKDTLTEEGYRVLEAHDGFEGVAQYRSHVGEIEIVILDLSMPSMGGDKAFRQIREINPTAKIILVSGYDAVEVTRTFAGGDLSGFLQKPFQSSRLLEEIQRVLQRQ